jgi:hypothetical protein
VKRLAASWARFWTWYERNYRVNVTVATALFALQVIHLIWLSSDVVWARLTGHSLFHLEGALRYLVIVVDYTEVPALVAVTAVYASDLRKRVNWRAVLFLAFLNSQWLHLFWITDEFILYSFSGRPATRLPQWLGWVAISIDYFELPVIVDTVRKMLATRRLRVPPSE